MNFYTVQVEASNSDKTIWQALDVAETVEDAGTAQDVADWVAQNQNIAKGGSWRVRVWEGRDADTGKEPAAEHEHEDEDGTEY